MHQEIEYDSNPYRFAYAMNNQFSPYIYIGIVLGKDREVAERRIRMLRDTLYKLHYCSIIKLINKKRI